MSCMVLPSHYCWTLEQESYFIMSIKLSDFSTNFWTLLKLLTLALSLKKSLKLSTNLHKKYIQPVKSDPSLLNGKIWLFGELLFLDMFFLPKEKLVSKEINKITTFYTEQNFKWAVLKGLFSLLIKNTIQNKN